MKPLHYHRFDPSACAYPRPRVPVLPPLTPAQLGRRRPQPATPRQHYARGRYALAAAYALACVGPRGALLAPAYHCRTMLDPAIALGAEIALYPLTPDLHADLDGLQRTAAACSGRPAALLLTHYFGLPREIDAVARWCHARGIRLIEDCSHALPGTGADAACGRAALGTRGHWAVSSPYKFFPCPDGGWLWANEGAALPARLPRRATAGAELRGLRAAWSQWRSPVPAPDPAAIEAERAALAARSAPSGRDWEECSDQPSADYRAADAGRAGLAVSRWIEQHSRLEPLVAQRRARYRQWQQAVAGLPGVSALLPHLPEGVAPYMFPLRVSEPARLFDPLKRMGLPIWRWDDMAASECPVARDYRQGVFHLPCHQALSDAQMAWMTALLQAVARRG